MPSFTLVLMKFAANIITCMYSMKLSTITIVDTKSSLWYVFYQAHGAASYIINDKGLQCAGNCLVTQQDYLLLQYSILCYLLLQYNIFAFLFSLFLFCSIYLFSFAAK